MKKLSRFIQEFMEIYTKEEIKKQGIMFVLKKY